MNHTLDLLGWLLDRPNTYFHYFTCGVSHDILHLHEWTIPEADGLSRHDSKKAFLDIWREVGLIDIDLLCDGEDLYALTFIWWEDASLDLLIGDFVKVDDFYLDRV